LEACSTQHSNTSRQRQPYSCLACRSTSAIWQPQGTHPRAYLHAAYCCSGLFKRGWGAVAMQTLSNLYVAKQAQAQTPSCQVPLTW
jgi:hypothetical protein